jgi:hypothetical protein
MGTVFNLVMDSPLFLVLFFGILLMFVDAMYISKGSSSTKKAYTIISLIIVGLMVYTYVDSLARIFDSIAKGAVALIYFPSVLEYITTLVISLIILVVSIASKRVSKPLKIINSLIFLVNSFVFLLIVDQIATNEVDLTNKVSIYTNSNLSMLLELSIVIFVAWVIGLTLYKIINTLTPKAEKHEEVNLKTQTNFYEAPVLPADINELRQEALMAAPRVHYVVESAGERLEDMFTLEEYKEMRELLETIKKKKLKKQKKTSKKKAE